MLRDRKRSKRNPAGKIQRRDILKNICRVNFARIDARELPDLLRQIEIYLGRHVTRLAIKLMALTFNQLANTPRNAVSAAYNHALYLKPRAKMMQDWADFLDQIQRGAKVLPFREAVA